MSGSKRLYFASFAEAAGSLTVTYASNEAFRPSRSSSYVS